jgi:hypothetical protein
MASTFVETIGTQLVQKGLLWLLGHKEIILV